MCVYNPLLNHGLRGLLNIRVQARDWQKNHGPHDHLGPPAVKQMSCYSFQLVWVWKWEPNGSFTGKMKFETLKPSKSIKFVGRPIFLLVAPGSSSNPTTARWFWPRLCLCTCWAAFGLQWGTLKAVGSSRSGSMSWVPWPGRPTSRCAVRFLSCDFGRVWGEWFGKLLHLIVWARRNQVNLGFMGDFSRASLKGCVFEWFLVSLWPVMHIKTHWGAHLLDPLKHWPWWPITDSIKGSNCLTSHINKKNILSNIALGIWP